MNDPHRDVGATTLITSRAPDCDDVQLLRRIGQGDEDAMAAFYREHGRVVLAQVLLVVGERVLAEEIVQDTMLVAEVTGQAAGGRDRAHLAACEHCRAEARRSRRAHARHRQDRHHDGGPDRGHRVRRAQAG